jgi:hypothetical protein
MDQGEIFNDAVTIVRDSLSQESARILQFSIKKNERDPAPLKDSGFGVAIRNLLAQHGIVREEVIMYSVWFAILNEAIQRLLD